MYATKQSVGLDLRAAWQIILEPGSVTRIETTMNGSDMNPDINSQSVERWFAQVMPRSGMSLKGIMVIPGTIDQDYTGNIGVIVYNLNSESYMISKGDRIAQLVYHLGYGKQINAETKAVERGAAGFGSSGVE
jgi:dUTP pyrophosphatase